MIHAVLVDDEVQVLRGLELLIKKFIPEVKVVATSSDPEAAIELINDYRPDVVFLDINMPDLNGFELLQKLSYRKFHLVFTTAYEEYALRAIKESALDYLLKPVDPDELKKTIAKIKHTASAENSLDAVISTLREIAEKQKARILLTTKDETQYVIPSEIVCIEASARNSVVTLTSGRSLMVIRSLKDFEEELCAGELQFLRVHLSFIINLTHITRYLKDKGGQLIMQGGKAVPVSKLKKNEILAYLKI